MRLGTKGVIVLVAVVWWGAAVVPVGAVDEPWGHVVELTDPNAVGGDGLGVSVAIDGDRIVAGAPHDDGVTAGPNSGAVHVFTHNTLTGVWEHDQELTDPNAAEQDVLGRSVAIDGDRIVAGACADDRDRGCSWGAVHVFTHNPLTGVWEHDQELTDPNAAEFDMLGVSVAIDGDRIVAGAWLDDGGGSNWGAVHVFTHDPLTGVWEHDQELTDPNAADGDELGVSVAIDGDRIVAGEAGVRVQIDGTARGGVHVFTRNPSTGVWEHDQELTDPNTADFDEPSFSVAIDGDRIVAGVRGAVHVYGVVIAPIVTISGPSFGAPDIEATFETAITNGSGPRVFAWSLTNNGTSVATGSGETLDYTPAVTGAHTVSLTVEDNAGLDTDTFEFTVMTDIGGSLFVNDIVWLANEGITKGCNPPVNDQFCPDANVTRGQMAALLVRALGLMDRLADPFVDDDDSIFEADIERLAAAGITKGCNPPVNDQFCPDANVTRGQMAALLVRALGYTDDGGGNLFVDDDGSIFEADINRLAMAGVTRGCNPPVNSRFCPDSFVTRGQMAAFLHRALL